MSLEVTVPSIRIVQYQPAWAAIALARFVNATAAVENVPAEIALGRHCPVVCKKVETASQSHALSLIYEASASDKILASVVQHDVIQGFQAWAKAASIPPIYRNNSIFGFFKSQLQSIEDAARLTR